ncbi:DUF3267 domain-containing protein [Spirosoma aerolatum]|uniref:DUF3267 domain-containing protein n=1 Tax=Spirosoma aerolatum TaxID=1211326 RepID=UPI001FE3D192|nr:DUF3267 domain-containing protein [Spirosoma aerolatum]
MNVKPQELISLGYHMDQELDHSELVPFVKTNLKRINPVSIFYWGFNIVVVVALIFFLIQEKRLPVSEAITKLFLGVFIFFVILLPIHELIHGFFYKVAGAQNVQFTAHWRTLVFYCLADNFVADAKSFLVVALTPFLMINSGLIAMLFFVSPALFYTLFGALLLHTGGCFGDFGLVSYFYENRQRKPVTYDDAQAKKSYFLLRPA